MKSETLKNVFIIFINFNWFFFLEILLFEILKLIKHFSYKHLFRNL